MGEGEGRPVFCRGTQLGLQGQKAQAPQSINSRTHQNRAMLSHSPVAGSPCSAPVGSKQHVPRPCGGAAALPRPWGGNSSTCSDGFLIMDTVGYRLQSKKRLDLKSQLLHLKQHDLEQPAYLSMPQFPYVFPGGSLYVHLPQ